RFSPPACPNPACRLVPRIPMKISGKAKSEMIRARSRSSLTKSRCAIARTADSSCIGRIGCVRVRLVDDLEIGVLEGRGVRADDAERRLDRAQHLVRPARLERQPERARPGIWEVQA